MTLEKPDLSGRTAFITGTTRGIGKALALALASLVLPVETTLQPCSASASASALPMPRVVPVMNAVRSERSGFWSVMPHQSAAGAVNLTPAYSPPLAAP